MAQTSVTNKALGTGVVGEFYSTEPQRTRGKLLVSASELLNVIGSVATQVAAEADQAGIAASTVFAGIIGTPKSLFRLGLEAETVIPNGTAVELIQQGFVIVPFTAAADIGDFVYYSNVTGVLTTAAPGATAPALHTRLPGGTVEIFNVAVAGIGVIYLDSAGDKTEPA